MAITFPRIDANCFIFMSLSLSLSFSLSLTLSNFACACWPSWAPITKSLRMTSATLTGKVLRSIQSLRALRSSYPEGTLLTSQGQLANGQQAWRAEDQTWFSTKIHILLLVPKGQWCIHWKKQYTILYMKFYTVHLYTQTLKMVCTCCTSLQYIALCLLMSCLCKVFGCKCKPEIKNDERLYDHMDVFRYVLCPNR